MNLPPSFETRPADYSSQPPYPHYAPPPPPAPTRGVPVIVWICVAAVVFVVGLGVTFVVGVAFGARAGAHAAPPDEPSLGSRTAPALPTPRRDVPAHDVELLSGCSAADLDLIERRIGEAIEVGAPIYNRGDFQGCFSTYERTARDIETTLPSSCKGPAGALAKGRSKAATQVRASDKAWAMRDAFDGLLDVIDRAPAR